MLVRQFRGDRGLARDVIVPGHHERGLCESRDGAGDLDSTGSRTAPEIAGRLRALEEVGLDQVMILPPFEPRYKVLERVARDIMPLVASTPA